MTNGFWVKRNHRLNWVVIHMDKVVAYASNEKHAKELAVMLKRGFKLGREYQDNRAKAKEPTT